MTDIKLDIPDITVVVNKGENYTSFIKSTNLVVTNEDNFYHAADFASSASYALTASYVAGDAGVTDWSEITNKPTVVSSSTQVDYNQLQNLPQGIETASYVEYADIANKPTLISSSTQIQLDQISGTTFANQTYTFPSDIIVDGTLTATQYNVVSSSILYSSGSTKFGDTLDDIHQFTGSVSVDGTLYAPSITGSFKGDGSQLTGLVTDLRISGSTGNDVVSLLTDDLTITGNNGLVAVVADNVVTIDVPDTLTATASIADNITIIRAGIYETGSDSVIIPTPAGGLSYVTSASYAATASYAIFTAPASVFWSTILQKPNNLVSSSTQVLQYGILATTGSNNFVGNQTVTGSFTVSGSSTFTNVGPAVFSGSVTTTAGFTGSIYGTSSWANNADYAIQAGVVDFNNITNKPEIVSSSNQIDVGQATFAVTASNQFTNDQTITGSINLTNNGVFGDTVTSTTNGTPIALNYGITKGDLTNRFAGIKVRNYDWGGGNLAGEVSIWTDSEAQDYSTQRILIDGFGNVEVTGSLTVTGTTNVTGSLYGTSSWAENVMTASYALSATATLPEGTVSSSTQINTGSFSGSFVGTLIGTLSGTIESASYAITASYAESAIAIIPNGVVSSSVQIKELLPDNTISSSAQIAKELPTGIVSSSSQVSYTGLTNIPNGIVSASSQIDVRNTTGIITIATTGSNTYTGIQTINNTTNSTLYNNGALIVDGGVGIGKDVNISGSLTILGVLTVASMSTQYVTSSQLNVSDNKITVQSNDLTRFGGLSIYDSGSTAATASIYWDSMNHKFLYENFSGLDYNSALFIAGPKNTGALGSEVGLTSFRVPVAHGDDHIDSRIQSSSIRVDFPSQLTHIEHGLVVTGSITTAASISGSFTGSIQLTGPISGTTLDKLDDVQDYTRSTIIDGYQLAWNSGSQEWRPTAGAAAKGTTRIFVSAQRNNTAAFYFNAIQLTSDSSAGTSQDTAFMLTSNLVSKVNVYLRSDTATTASIQLYKNGDGTAFISTTTASALYPVGLTGSMATNTIRQFTFSNLSFNNYDSLHIYCKPSVAGYFYGIVTIE